MNRELDNVVEAIYQTDPRYKTGAYEFVMEALSFTQRKFQRLRHVTGEELLEGIKELLIEKFGPMTLLVLHHWGIRESDDFGNIVFNLVNHRVLSKTQEDNIESFRNRFDFKEVFHHQYRRQLEKRITKMR